jgi:predicted RNase H-like nuclease (RuvC/YqgF family)
MKIGSFLLVPLIFLAFAQPASAEFYRYLDEHGNVMFTDDLSKVPADQRDKVKPYEETQSTPAPKEVKNDAGPATKAPPADNPIEQERARLQEQETSLNAEYENLMSTRTQLNEEKQKAVTNAQIKEYNAKIVEFNAQIQAYEKKRDALADAVTEFNKKVEDQAQEAN